MALNTFSTFQNNAQKFIAAKTLMRINRDVIVAGLGRKERLPNRFARTFQFTRYEKLALPQSPLTEGVTPTGRAMTISTVQAVMDQFGDVVELSDIAVITAKHPALQQAIELIGEQAAELIDREVIEILLSNTNVTFPGSATSRATLAGTDVIDTTTVKRVMAALRSQGARPVSARMMWGLTDPFMEMDLLEDATFKDAASESNIRALQNGEVGMWMGTRWLVSNLLPSVERLADVTTASSATSGSLAVSTNHFIKVVAVDDALGFDVAVTQQQTQATAAAQTSINVTMPATRGRTYKVYVGTTSGNLFLSSSGNAPGAVVNFGTVPTSGEQPIANPATGVTVRFAWIMGMEAFAVPELQSLETFITPDAPSDSDPLKQRRKVGWKVNFKPVILNEDFIERIEASSAFD